jgi:hypothetical protein
MIVGVSGQSGNEEQLNSCLPASWKVADGEESEAAEDTGDSSKIDKILDIVSKVINFACQFKAPIKKLFGKKLRLYNKKLFIQHMARYKKKWIGSAIKKGISKVGKVAKGAVKKVGKVAKGAVKAVGKAAKATGSAIKSAAGAVGDWVGKKWEQVKELGSKAVQGIKNLFAMIKSKIQKFLSSDLVANVKKIVECGKTLKGTIKSTIAVIMGIQKKIATITAGGLLGLAKVFIDLVCNFDIFRQAVTTLIKGLKERVVTTKYKLIGEFVGLLFKAIGSRRFRLIKLYNR